MCTKKASMPRVGICEVLSVVLVRDGEGLRRLGSR